MLKRKGPRRVSTTRNASQGSDQSPDGSIGSEFCLVFLVLAVLFLVSWVAPDILAWIRGDEIVGF